MLSNENLHKELFIIMSYIKNIKSWKISYGQAICSKIQTQLHERIFRRMSWYGIYRVATVNWMWHSRTFQGLSRTFFSKFKVLLYQTKHTCTILKSFIILYINLAMRFTRFASGEKSSLVTSKVLWSVLTNSSFWLFLAVEKAKKKSHSSIFKDHNPNSRTFQGLEFFFFCQFQGFPGFSRAVATLCLGTASKWGLMI